jgi:O-antigen/teichoic acid export membrane protein
VLFRSVRFNLVRLGFYFVNLALLLAVWAAAPTMSLDWVVMANLASVYGALAFAAWLLQGFRYSSGSSNETAKTNDVKNVLRLGLVFALPAALAQFSGSIYQIILEHHLGVKPLGLFVVYFTYSRILSPVGSAIASHVFYHGITGEDRDIAHICRLSLIIYIGCSLPLWLIAWWLIPMIFGPGFVVDLWGIAFLLVSCLFALLADSMAEFLKGHKKVRADTEGRVIYLVTVGILGWWWVTLWGLIGMAFAMVLADILRYAYLVGYVGRFTGQFVGEFWRVTRLDVAALIISGRMVFLGPRK